MLLFNKTNIQKSGFLEGFTDHHSHLLPGVDDGFRTMEESLAALSYMESAGVAEIWLTPHIMEDIPNTTAGLRARYEELKAAYKGGIRLRLAAENMLDTLFEQRLEAGDMLTMDGDVLLVETSYFNPPLEFHEILTRVAAKGYHPLLAHPERYKYMEMDDYEKLKRQGIMFQLNLGAIAGGYSKDTQHKAAELLKRGYYDFVGSDCHNLRSYQAANEAGIPSSILKAIRQIPNSL